MTCGRIGCSCAHVVFLALKSFSALEEQKASHMWIEAPEFEAEAVPVL